MPRHQPPYPVEFQRQMVDLVRSCRTPEELAREFEPTAQAIWNWVRQAYRDGGGREAGLPSIDWEELPFTHHSTLLRRSEPLAPSARLRRENRQLRLAIHAVSRGTYGAPRIHAELKAVSRKRGARMRQAALCRGQSAERAGDDPSGPGGTTGAGLRQPQLHGRGSQQALGRGHHLCTDARRLLVSGRRPGRPSRRIVGWSMANHLRTELKLEAFEMALGQRRPADVVHHADQGSQYTSLAFSGAAGKLGAAVHGSVGDAYDKAMCESFFATLECELLARRRFTSQSQARMAVFSYIEGWYNPGRRHSALGYLSPIEYKNQMTPES